MGQRVTAVEEDSIARELGIEAGWTLEQLNGRAMVDLFDYQEACGEEELSLLFLDENGAEQRFELEKDAEEGLGLAFEEDLMSPMRCCANHCLFCFEDQLPDGVDEGLHARDDDWRLSFIMGTYVTLTNVGERELERLLHHHPSPLYLSVHATNPELRAKLLQNPRAGALMEQLKRLAEAGIQFHTQIVLCPGYNDGAELERTIRDLLSFGEALCSVAVVPVGLSAHRKGLTPLRRVSKWDAQSALSIIAHFAGQGPVYAADELYLLAETALPANTAYGDYPQWENGVGMLRLFEEEFDEAIKELLTQMREVMQLRRRSGLRRVVVATGESAAPFLRRLIDKAQARLKLAMTVELVAVPNRFFGRSVTVAGLMVGNDLAEALVEALEDIQGLEVLLPGNALRDTETGPRFLDDTTPAQVEQLLGCRLKRVPIDGAAFLQALLGL